MNLRVELLARIFSCTRRAVQGLTATSGGDVEITQVLQGNDFGATSATAGGSGEGPVEPAGREHFREDEATILYYGRGLKTSWAGARFFFLEAWVAGAVSRERRRQFIIKGVSHKFKGATGGFKAGCEGAL